MADSEKKETVESPTSGEHAIVKMPAKESELVRGFDSIFDEFRRSFDDLMAPFMPMRTFLPRAIEALPIRAPLVDVIDDGNQYIINTELPGFAKEDVDIQLNKDFMVLKAEKKSEKEEKSENYLHKERSSFLLPENGKLPGRSRPLESRRNNGQWCPQAEDTKERA